MFGIEDTTIDKVDSHIDPNVASILDELSTDDIESETNKVVSFINTGESIITDAINPTVPTLISPESAGGYEVLIDENFLIDLRQIDSIQNLALTSDGQIVHFAAPSIDSHVARGVSYLFC